MSDDLVAVGRIGPARGVRGDVFVEPWTDDPDSAVRRRRRAADRPRRAAAHGRSSSTAGGKLVVHFDGVDDREAAQRLRGTQLLIAAAERPTLDDPDEFYADDLVGLPRRRSGRRRCSGRCATSSTSPEPTTSSSTSTGGERLVPFVAAIVPTVDLAAGASSSTRPTGLFDL